MVHTLGPRVYIQLQATFYQNSKPQVKSNTHSLQGFNGVLSPKHQASNLNGEKLQIYSVEILLFPSEFLFISFEVSTLYSIRAQSPLIFNNFQISVYWLPEPEPYIDMAVLAHADYFLGSCVLELSTYVATERQLSGKPIDFSGVYQPQNIINQVILY